VVRIEGETIINRPVDEVFDFVADERNEPRYNPRMRRVEQITPGPIGVGTRFRAETANMGRTVEMVIEFTGYDRPRRLASTTHMSSMDLSGSLTFEPMPDGTRMRWSWDPEPGGILKMMRPLVRRHRPTPGADHLGGPQASSGRTRELTEDGRGPPRPSESFDARGGQGTIHPSGTGP